MSQFTHSALLAALEVAAKPFCNVADSVAVRFSSSPFRQNESHLEAAELDVETLLRCLAEFRGGYSLWPEYDEHSLSWLLSFMERMKGHGDALRRFVLRDGNGKIVGWYIYYVTAGGLAEVAQIGGARQCLKSILDHLFHDAWSHGSIALHGVVDRSFMDDFSEKNCIFTCRGGWTVAHSRKPHLLELLNHGDAFLSRLDGEWCLAFGG